MDVKVVQVHDTIVQLQKFDNLPADVEKAIENAQALVKDSESSRRVCILHILCIVWHPIGSKIPGIFLKQCYC